MPSADYLYLRWPTSAAFSLSASTTKGNDATVPMDASPSVDSASGTKDGAPTGAVSPFVLRHGRRYLHRLPYPLPCDLPELQRQNLHTFLATSVFGSTLCSPSVVEDPPLKVLDIACGSGYWASLCDGYLKRLGRANASFTGVDVVPLAPDLRKQGVDWRFVQHDVRKVPLPFEDEEFDLIFLKDLSLVLPLGPESQRLLDECMRVLTRGGILEIWECDHVVRSLLPHPPPPAGKRSENQECAEATGTFLISPATPFGTARNDYLRDCNAWIQKALSKRTLSPTPCARVAPMLLQEPDDLRDVGWRRVAIPLDDLRWDRKDGTPQNFSKPRSTESSLTEEQAALRRTALLVVVQMIESLEPLLKSVSGKSHEEWQRWWAWMMSDLLEHRGATNGECLEIGAWWARKV